MPKLTIDNLEVTVPEGTNVLEAARALDIVIPHFCYHEALGAVGSCRLCAMTFLEGPVNGLQMACMVKAKDGMVVSSTDPDAVELREHVIEWAMTNHPHDCPVCDEGGECQLQEMTVAGGHGVRRYTAGPWPVCAAGDEPLYHLLPLRTDLSRLLRRYRLRGLRFPQPDSVWSSSGRHAGKPFLRQYHRCLPHRSPDQQAVSFQDASLGSAGSTVNLPALQPWLRDSSRWPLPRGTASQSRNQPGYQRLLYLRPRTFRLRSCQPPGQAASAACRWPAGRYQ
ncbi:MAG: (2Fe-2S)-binding protein [Deltaproteobacteria bacterium]|nr:(2Fe-2S)-binding protein [Deltaproteobacteria bacterium]